MWEYALVALIVVIIFLVNRFLIRYWNRFRYIAKEWKNKQIKDKFYAELEKIDLHKIPGYLHFENIEKFKERLNQVILLCERFEICFCLMVIEVDNLFLLKQNTKSLFYTIKNRLQKVLRKVDIVAQIDQNSFLILLPMKYKIRNAAQIAHRMQASLVVPFLVENKMVVISSSIGIAIYPDDGINVDTLLEGARDAVKKARSVGENRYHFHEEIFQEMHHNESTIVEILQKENFPDLLKIRTKRYIDRETNLLKYIYVSPLVDVETVGVVELIKYPHAVSASGKQIEIFENVMRHAISQIFDWKKASPSVQGVIVPITVNQIQNRILINNLVNLMRKNNINADQIIFDISAIDDTLDPVVFDNLIDVLKKNNLNIALSIFLFSQLPVLNVAKLPIKILKIDTQILQDLINDKENVSIIKMIINIAQESDITLMVDHIQSGSKNTIILDLNSHIIYDDFIDANIDQSSAVLYKGKVKSKNRLERL